tara:strand:- start:18393 stop:19049 length:657 start_codon:yes stop_codon:yes gene_type:complete
MIINITQTILLKYFYYIRLVLNNIDMKKRREGGYYTPTIEEFYVGFEYEITTMSTGGLLMMDFSKNTSTKLGECNHKVWEKAVLTSTMADTGEMITSTIGDMNITRKDESLPMDHRGIEDIVSFIKSKKIRVKCLDQEDIESQGFVIDEEKSKEDNRSLYSRGNVRLIHFTEGHIAVYTADPSKCDIFSRINIDPILINYIEVKNKSELKKILKQIGL